MIQTAAATVLYPPRLRMMFLLNQTTMMRLAKHPPRLFGSRQVMSSSKRSLASSARPLPMDDSDGPAVLPPSSRPPTSPAGWTYTNCSTGPRRRRSFPSATMTRAVPAETAGASVVPTAEVPSLPQTLQHSPPSLPAPLKVDTTYRHPDDPTIVEDASTTTSSPSWVSPSTLTYMDGVTMPITTRLHLVTPDEDAPSGIWPVFRLMDENGTWRNPSADHRDSPSSDVFGATQNSAASSNLLKPSVGDMESLRAYLEQLYPYHAKEVQHNGLFHAAPYEYPDTQSTNTLMRAYHQMVRLKKMDHILLNAQRQGRISFYMTCRGEEAIHVGAASALELQDPILAQYREQGLLMWRGFTLDQFTNQCFSNNADLGKGRQMPVHYGSRALNYHTVSSPLGTQLPQAVGVAYRLKLANRPNVAACFFGDGCASTTDFHAALNFAATLEAPVIFICRNNGYAISTPIREQYRGDGIISRAKGYGMAGIRVDGNDVFAMHAAIREAKRCALEHSAPVLVEAITYRQGHHSTSDDSTRYRSASEVNDVTSHYDPISRLGNFLKDLDWLTLDDETAIRDQERLAVLKAVEQAERRPPPPLDSMFEDVYHQMPRNLRDQQAQLHAHLAKYPKHYQQK